MLAEAGGDVFGFARGGDDGIASLQGLCCDQGAKTTGCSSDEPGTHSNSPVWARTARAFLMG
ncbi:hypothetical protein D3C76_1484450 [compost metagenome]